MQINKAKARVHNMTLDADALNEYLDDLGLDLTLEPDF